MKLLTPPSWTGLPIYECEYRKGDPGQRLPMTVLLLWPSDGMSLQVSIDPSRRTGYQSRGGRFDFIPSDAFVAVTKVDRVVHPIVIEIPHAWAPAPLHFHVQFGDRRLDRLVAGLLGHCASHEPEGAHYTQALSAVLVDRLLALSHGTSPHRRYDITLPPAVQRKVLELIDDRLDCPPDVATLAALAGQGTVRFLRSFKATLGVPLHQYVMRRRIEKARQLLATTASALSSIALELGFASHAHFSMAFHKQTGATPSAFRQERRGRLQCPAPVEATVLLH